MMADENAEPNSREPSTDLKLFWTTGFVDYGKKWINFAKLVEAVI